MVRRQGFSTLAALLLSVLAADISLDGQNLSPSTPGPRKLADLIPGFVQDNLQNIDPSIRPSIFPVVNSTINLASINSSVATELSNLPLPSPASGLRYAFDPAQGVYVPSVQSLGPILTERGETIGK